MLSEQTKTGRDALFRLDFDQLRTIRSENRPKDRLVAHYLLETRLAQKLARSSRTGRSTLYSEVYRDLFAGLPDHPQHRGNQAIRQQRIQNQARTLSAQLRPGDTYVEIGCGDAELTKAVAPHVAAAIGIDVTPELVTPDAPATFRFLLSDGITIDMPDNSADLVFSNQLMEHLHVDDALDQLREIHRVLKPGGRYICCTPNRLSGPHDISVYFSRVPMGFHLREYDHRSLGTAFHSSGFTHLRAVITAKGRSFEVPLPIVSAAERMLEALPETWRGRIAISRVVSALLGMTLVGTK